MSQVKVSGNASGTGVIEISAPNTNTNYTLTLPQATTTLVGTDATQTLTNKTIYIDSAQFATVSGTAPIYGCRAWVSFDGSRNVTNTGASTNGQPVYIRASGNVTSVTKNSTGLYTVNFTTAMPDTNYSVLTTSENVDCGTGYTNGQTTLPTTSAVVVYQFLSDTNAYMDGVYFSVAIFR